MSAAQAPRQGNPESSQRRRVLIASQGHPRIARGGAEIAAHELFRELQSSPDCDVWFLGCNNGSLQLRERISQPFTEREFIYTPGPFDGLKFANRDQLFPPEFERLLREINPEIVHFHHYANFGVEALSIVKRVLPAAKVVLTLHEYQAICANNGQMITRPDRHLCYEATPLACSRCFPEYDQSEFVVRKWYISHFFEEADHFVAPSEFLKERYVAWGLPEEKISVIANAIPAASLSNEREAVRQDGLFKVGMFGQLSPFKGVGVLLEAARLLEQDYNRNIAIEIYGDYKALPDELSAETEQLLANAGRNVRYLGPYDEKRTDRLMQGVDVVVVPSIWWENAPLVIEEAFRNRRPVICSDVGGMAERVRDGIDGFHFPVGDPIALARLLERIAALPEKLQEIRRTIGSAARAEDAAQEHKALYDQLLD